MGLLNSQLPDRFQISHPQPYAEAVQKRSFVPGQEMLVPFQSCIILFTSGCVIHSYCLSKGAISLLFLQNFLTAALQGLNPLNCVNQLLWTFPTVVGLSCHEKAKGQTGLFIWTSVFVCVRTEWDIQVPCELFSSQRLK